MRKLLMQASHIRKVYRQGQPDQHLALDNISLQIYAGDFITILGPQGAGKTTLLLILALHDPPTSGDLYYEGRLVTGLTNADLRPDILFLDEPTALPSTPPDQTVILATADPEIAAHGSAIYRLTEGRLTRIGG
jgi:ABC-type iron transport system FetAB ATPase subunit